MKYGVREICDVTLRAKATMTIGNRVFYKNEPVIFFDSLKTSTMEGASTTVYAQGGRGNSRLMAWEGERTVTFTMEDALISPESLAILTGADIVEANGTKPVIQHVTEITTVKGHDDDDKGAINEEGESIEADQYGDSFVYIQLNQQAYEEDGKRTIYVMKLDDQGNVISEPYLFHTVKDHKDQIVENVNSNYSSNARTAFKTGDPVLVDYYVAHATDAMQINIKPDSFAGNFYLDASTLFRDASGTDHPAEFIIPNCKIQSNFTFTMASSGDPSTFTFTMDAFPDYTRWDPSTKVLSAIQIIDDFDNNNSKDVRKATPHTYTTTTTAGN